MKFITGGFVVGLSSKKKKGSSAEREREDLPRSKEARGVVAVRGIVSEPSSYLYTPCFVAFDFEEPGRVQLCPYNLPRLSGARIVKSLYRCNQQRRLCEGCLNALF